LSDPSVYELSFLGMPPSPNDKMGFRAKAKATKEWRQMACLKAKQVGVPSMEKVKLSAVFTRRNLGVADEDNDHGRLKPIVDGLRDAGVIKNDTRGYVVWGAIDEEHGVSGFRLGISGVVGCTRCGQAKDDCAPFILDTRFCAHCYVLLLGAFLKQTPIDSVEEFLREWLESRNQ
jgi:hypothetical protein